MPIATVPFKPSIKRDNVKRDRIRALVPWRGWYGLKRWTDIRARQLAAEPLCAMCDDLGVITAASVCDHVEAHRGDPALFWNGPWQSLCPTHHNRDKQRVETNYQYRPEWLAPSRIPFTIVCGAPASGKTTYVAEHAKDEHLIIDLDAIASRMAGNDGDVHAWDRERLLGPAMRERNNLLGALSKQPPWKAAWLIVAEPIAVRRQWWHDKMQPCAIIVMETPPDACFARVRSDARRDRDRAYDAITRWWSAYERREGDQVEKVNEINAK